MSEISTYKLIKEKLQAIPPNQKGSLFEKISKHFLKEHDSANTSLLIFGTIGH
ncbi:hypothetical protein SLK237_06930 [Helicobacter pylori]